jgi:hypothetical protein
MILMIAAVRSSDLFIRAVIDGSPMDRRFRPDPLRICDPAGYRGNMATKKSSKKAARSTSYEVTKVAKNPSRLYTLEVFLLSGMLEKKFVKKNPVISRKIQIRGDQTLADLHEAIFDAYDRFDPHLYEFQFGKRMHEGPKYGPRTPDGFDDGEPSGIAEETTIDSLELKVDRAFGYWFDFGDDWMHQIDVVAIDEGVAKGKYPKLISSVGASPPQYLGEDDMD